MTIIFDSPLNITVYKDKLFTIEKLILYFTIQVYKLNSNQFRFITRFSAHLPFHRTPLTTTRFSLETPSQVGANFVLPVHGQ